MAETILVVDDEEPVRRTFREWLDGADLGCEVLSAGDAAAALTLANQRGIDLAILDWNLGAGNNGLQLLEDLCVFNPDVVAILITGYAHQATPLDAMRMGVRDYLDKNQELNRDTFLAAVRKQLERIRPAKRERQLQHGLAQFRDSVDQVLPLVRTAAAFNDPVPLTESIRSLFRFMLRMTQARDGVLVVRGYQPGRQPPETYRAYDIEGRELSVPVVPFSRTVAGTALSLQEPCAWLDPNGEGALGEAQGVQLQPFERSRKSLLAVPLIAAGGLTAVLELFDKTDQAGFSTEDRQLMSAAAELGAMLIRQGLAERQTHGTLLDALQAALEASRQVSSGLQPVSEPGEPAKKPAESPGDDRGDQGDLGDDLGEKLSLRVAGLLRDICERHGPQALEECVQLLRSVRRLLDSAAGVEE